MIAPLCCIVLLTSQAGWSGTALDHEWFGHFDRALVARIAALQDEDTPQRRSDIARAAAEYEALARVLRIPVLDEPPLELDDGDRGFTIAPLFKGDRGPKIAVSHGLIAAAWKDLRVFDEATGRLVADPIDLEALIEKHGRIGQLELNAKGTRVAVAFSETLTLYVFDVATGSATWVETNLASRPAWSPTEDAIAYHAFSQDQGRSSMSLVLYRFDDQPTRLLSEVDLDWDRPILFSPDGSLLALGGRNDAAVVLSTETGEEIARRARGLGDIVTFHPDGESLILAGRQRRASMRWSFNEHAESIVPVSGLLGLEFMAPAPSLARGKNFLLRCGSEFVSLDLETGQRSRPSLGEPDGWRHAPSALSPNGRFFAQAPDVYTPRHILVWDTDTGKRIGPEGPQGPRPALFSVGAIEELEITDAGRIVACGQDGAIRIYETDRLVPIDLNPAPNHQTVVTDDAGLVGAAVSEFSTLTLVGVDGVADATSIRLPGTLSSLEVNRDGSMLGCTGAEGGAWVASIEPTGSTSHALGVPRLVFEGKVEVGKQWVPWSAFGGGDVEASAIPIEESWQVIASLPDAKVQLRSDELRQELRWVEGEQVISGVDDLFPETLTSRIERWQLDGDRVLGFHEGQVEIVNPKAGTQIAVVKPFGETGSCRMAGDRFIMWREREARVYDAATGKMLREFKMDRPIADAVPVPGTTAAVVLDRLSTVAGVDLESLTATTSELAALGKKPGVQVATQGLASVIYEDGSVRMFDARAGRSWMLRKPDGRGVLGSRLSPDGERLVTLVEPNELMLYDTETRQVLASHLVPRTDAAEGADRWVRWGDTQFNGTGELLLLAPSVIVDSSSYRPKYGPDQYTVIRATTGEPLSSFYAPGGPESDVRLLGNGERLLARVGSELRLFQISVNDCQETLAIEHGTLLKESRAAGEVIVLRSFEHESSWSSQIVAVDIEDAKIARVLTEESGRTWVFGRSERTPIRVLAKSDRWLNTETGRLIAGAPTLSDGYDGRQSMAYGPDGLVLVNSCQLGRVVDDQFQKIGRRHWYSDFNGWNERVLGEPSSGASFIGGERILAGALPRLHGLQPVVLDFGPAHHEPLKGTPDELLREWCERLDLRVSENGDVVPALE